MRQEEVNKLQVDADAAADESIDADTPEERSIWRAEAMRLIKMAAVARRLLESEGNS